VRARLLVGLWLAGGAGLGLLPPGPALALEPASGTYDYRIRHALFGDIGAHRMTVRREAGAIVVEHAAELAVEILGLTAFHRRTRFREVWRDDRLVAFEGLVEDNGERFPVTARAEGDHLVIEGSAGRIEAPLDTAPSEPSLERAIERAWFFDSKTGALLHATVTRAAREPLKLGQDVVEATSYEITGELDQQVWFDATGVWAQWRLWRQGAAITLTRER
jgi:Domain of unknown function (DUF6134)